MNKKRIISGIQTTGELHLGNYLGAIKRWAEMQDQYESIFFLADLHAITIDKDPALLRKSSIEIASSLLACGIDPTKSIIFTQSHVKAHTVCAWLFNCVTPMGTLSRMTQFKEKSGTNSDLSTAGLFTYPILQAADILLYNVGFDSRR
jgi:tryptophanyl-tRNA synthetase